MFLKQTSLKTFGINTLRKQMTQLVKKNNKKITQSSDFLLYNKHPSSTLNLPQITPLFPPQNQPRSHPNCNQFRPKPPTILCMQSVINLPRATSPHPSPPLFLFYLISLALRPFSVYFCVSSCTQFLPWHERVRQDNSFTKSLNRSSFHLSQQLI